MFDPLRLTVQKSVQPPCAKGHTAPYRLSLFGHLHTYIAAPRHLGGKYQSSLLHLTRLCSVANTGTILQSDFAISSLLCRRVGALKLIHICLAILAV